MPTFRTARAADVPAIGKLHYSAWMETYRGLLSEDYLATLTPERMATIFARRAPANLYLLEEEGALSGFVLVGHGRESDLPPRTGELCGIYLLAASQGKGHGKTLFDWAANRLRGLGYRRMIAWVLATNKKAIGFYEAMGMHPDGKNQFANLGGPAMEIRMTMDL
ncbi:MAG: GNAT family N-acetyltransferase [Clostridia bacterium]|nr:GNAT family N-acetyltransferase [Clostridia bacterium]